MNPAGTPPPRRPPAGTQRAAFESRRHFVLPLLSLGWGLVGGERPAGAFPRVTGSPGRSAGRFRSVLGTVYRYRPAWKSFPLTARPSRCCLTRWSLRVGNGVLRGERVPLPRPERWGCRAPALLSRAGQSSRAAEGAPSGTASPEGRGGHAFL